MRACIAISEWCVDEYEWCLCRKAFDAVYGSSAGAINATYFLSGQRDGVNIYTEEIANEQFIDLRRLFKKEQGWRSPLLLRTNPVEHHLHANQIPLKI